MSNTQKIEVSNISLEDALLEISELSKNSEGLIVNKRSMEGLSQVLSGQSVDIENVAANNENNKIISTNKNESKPAAPKKVKPKAKKENKVKPS